jgi:hypothetical protein
MRIGFGKAQDELRLGHRVRPFPEKLDFTLVTCGKSLPNRPDEVNKPFSLKGFSRQFVPVHPAKKKTGGRSHPFPFF